MFRGGPHARIFPNEPGFSATHKTPSSRDFLESAELCPIISLNPHFRRDFDFCVLFGVRPPGYDEAVIESLLPRAPEVLSAPERLRGWNTEASGSGAKHSARLIGVIDLLGTSNRRLIRGANNSTCVQAVPIH
jgi:hypothetical protein